MPIFEIQTPDGKTYEVDAPDMNSAMEAIGQTGQTQQPQLPDVSSRPQPRPGTDFETFKSNFQAGAYPPMGDLTRTNIDDAMRSLARGVPLVGGAMDEIAAGLNTGFGYLGDYDKELATQRQRDVQYDTAHPYLSMTGQVAGGIGGTGAALKALPGLAAAVPATLPGRMAAGGVIGAGLGAEEAFTRGEGGFENRAAAALKTAPVSGGIGMALPLVGYGMGKAFDKLTGKGKTNIPSVDDLRASSQQAYKTAEQSGLVLNPESYASAVDDITKETIGQGFRQEIHPRISGAIKALQDTKGGSPTLQELELTRRVLKAAANSPERDERRLASIMIDKLDSYMESLQMPDIMAGDPAQALTSLAKARSLWSKVRKGEIMQDLQERAMNATGANYTSAGMETALRQQFRVLANSKNFKRQFTSEEQQAILKVVRGGPIENAVRLIGKLAPTGVISSALSGGMGYAIGGPIGAAALPATGYAARNLAASMTAKNARLADELMRSGISQGTSPTAEFLSRYAVPFGSLAGQGGAKITSGW